MPHSGITADAVDTDIAAKKRLIMWMCTHIVQTYTVYTRKFPILFWIIVFDSIHSSAYWKCFLKICVLYKSLKAFLLQACWIDVTCDLAAPVKYVVFCLCVCQYQHAASIKVASLFHPHSELPSYSLGNTHFTYLSLNKVLRINSSIRRGKDDSVNKSEKLFSPCVSNMFVKHIKELKEHLSCSSQ